MSKSPFENDRHLRRWPLGRYHAAGFLRPGFMSFDPLEDAVAADIYRHHVAVDRDSSGQTETHVTEHFTPLMNQLHEIRCLKDTTGAGNLYIS